MSSDGGQVYGEFRASNNEIFWQLGIADPRVDNKEIEWALLSTDWPGKLKPELSYLGRVLWERDGGRIRVALSDIQANIKYASTGLAFPSDLGSGTIKFEPTMLSLQYNSEYWSLTSEYALRHFDYKDFNPLVDTNFTGESYYVQGSYRFAPKWDTFLRYDAAYTDKKDRDGTDWAAAAPGRVAHKRFARDWTFGAGWMANPKLLVRGEFHIIEGTAWLPALDNTMPTKENWNMLNLSLSYRF